MGIVSLETRAPPAHDPRAEPDSSDAPGTPRSSSGPDAAAELASKETLSGPALERARGRNSSLPPPARDAEEDISARPTPMRPPGPTTTARPPPREPMHTPVLDADRAPETGHGASLPPFRLESPPPLLPKAPLMPKLGGAADELAEHLPLPAGLGHEPRSLEALPKSVLEARVAFTLLARELGLDYRLKRGIELRADVSGIEAMQSVLLESFPDHAIRTREDAYELRRHGALLSEILARRLEAEWIDISPSNVGYWAMIVPPDTRVWPFGRVARLIEMGHKERDLVSFFFEIQSRARGR